MRQGRPSQRRPAREFAIGVARAFGGAMFFALPLFMTMEMWELGFYMDRLRLATFLAVFVPVLIGLSHYAGFEETDTWWDDTRDAFVALLVGFVTAAAVLMLGGIVRLEMPLRESIGQITLAAIPASVGAALAESLLGSPGEDQDRKRREMGYGGELFLMAAGAIFFAFNIAPTEEMMLVAVKMSRWNIVVAGVLSLLLMHAFVYAVEFRGRHVPEEGVRELALFARFTVVGYAIALVMSAYVLWTFGRLDNSALSFQISTTIVLAFPASLGAAAARLVL
jgi:putative integral membrane protein (TIGR02587 family)